jgi:hypothetical protein
MFDLAGDEHSRNNWVRATCRVGVTPCNGLIYAPPHSCGCYMEAKLNGFWALAPRRNAEEKAPRRTERLEKGPAFEEVGSRNAECGSEDKVGNRKSEIGNRATRSAPTKLPHSDFRIPHSQDWPTYRGDVQRSGSAGGPIASHVKPLWKAELGGRLGPVTVAAGQVFVVEIDAHTVHALDADGGEPLWQYTVGGRIDSPPTCYRGLVLFGSNDGWVYCLRASDGALVWRFLAAPDELGAVAFDQVESLWPVHGSVLVQDGVAYAAAGRSSYLDGGIMLRGLDPDTGQVRCQTRVSNQHPGALDPPSPAEQQRMLSRNGQNNTDYKTFLAPDRSDAFAMKGARPDVLVSDGTSIFMRQLRFNGRLDLQADKRPHLFATSSLLDGSENHRVYRVLGTGDFRGTTVAFPWIVSRLSVPFGLMLAFDERTVWGVRRPARKSQDRGYSIFAMSRPDPALAANFGPDFERRAAQPAAGDGWVTSLPLRPRAMLRAGDVLVFGGMPDTLEAKAADEKDVRGLLQLVSAANGKTLRQIDLSASPVWDGMAAANGRLYVAAADGSVACLGP